MEKEPTPQLEKSFKDILLDPENPEQRDVVEGIFNMIDSDTKMLELVKDPVQQNEMKDLIDVYSKSQDLAEKIKIRKRIDKIINELDIEDR